ncbi:uncharacterized protein METZ01_LOCUS461819, partial [marine metagenome]
ANGFPVVQFQSGESNDAKLIGLTVQNGLTAINEWGAGIHIGNSSSPTLDHLIIQNNNAQSGRGGGIRVYDAGGDDALILKNLIIRNNNCRDMGGGIMVWNSTIDLSNSQIYGNTGGSVLHFWQGNGDLPISNCVINNNTGNNFVHSGGSLIFLNCTIVNNSGSILFNGNSAIINTIVGSEHAISNTGILNISHSLIEDGENSITTPLGASTTWGDGNLSQPPILNDSDDLSLSIYSPSIGAGADSIEAYN